MKTLRIGDVFKALWSIKSGFPPRAPLRSLESVVR